MDTEPETNGSNIIMRNGACDSVTLDTDTKVIIPYHLSNGMRLPTIWYVVVVVFLFNVPTAKVIWRRGHGLKSHPTDW